MRVIAFLCPFLQVASAIARDRKPPGEQKRLRTANFTARTTVAFQALQHWYNNDSGLWPDAGWWNSANILTILADFSLLNPTISPVVEQIFNTTYTYAPSNSIVAQKERSAEAPGRHSVWTRADGPQNPLRPAPLASAATGFTNYYYDDDGWWALAWLRAYDRTQDRRFLQTSVETFNDMVGGYNATCGGIWWNKARQVNAAISNELFLAVAAQLATRTNDKQQYLSWAMKQWHWFNSSGLIKKDFNILDEIDTKTCRAGSPVIWTYTHGVIVGALVDLEELVPDSGFARTAQAIAAAGMRYFGDKDGILHELCEPNCGADGNQFKGIFLRNLRKLELAHPLPSQRSFILRNAGSVWQNDRESTNNTLGLVWSGPYHEATAATHSSAMDALVAATAFEVDHAR